MVQERIVRASAPASIAPASLAATGQFVTTGEDSLRLNVVNAQPGVRVALSGRYVLAGESGVRALQDSFAPTATGLESTKILALPECTLLNLVVRATNATVPTGRCFVRVEVIRGSGATIVLGVLIAGYVGSWGGLAWPGTPLTDPSAGAGYVHLEQGGFPAAGFNPVCSLPEQTRWRVLSAQASLTTTAVLGTRSLWLRLVQDSTLVWQSPSSLQQGPGVTRLHAWGAGQSWLADPSGLMGNGGLPVGATLATEGALSAHLDIVAAGLDVGDTWTNLSALVEEWRNPVTQFL